jgi:abnormal spindle-like microcephaly-associated protein
MLKTLIACTSGRSQETDSSGLKELIDKRNEAINRQKSSQLHRSHADILRLVEQDICRKHLQLRCDRNILVDLGLQDSLFNILFSYELPWIRLGLETVFCEIISISLPFSAHKSSQRGSTLPCRTGCAKWKSAIKTFVQQRMFSSDTLTMQSHTHDQDITILTHQQILKKFLSLVLFLDAAKTRKILNFSTLFVREGGIKSSKDAVFAFYKGLMRGQGDVMKHLGLVGYCLVYTQSYVDECDFSVKNILVRTARHISSCHQ